MNSNLVLNSSLTENIYKENPIKYALGRSPCFKERSLPGTDPLLQGAPPSMCRYQYLWMPQETPKTECNMIPTIRFVPQLTTLIGQLLAIVC